MTVQTIHISLMPHFCWMEVVPAIFMTLLAIHVSRSLFFPFGAVPLSPPMFVLQETDCWSRMRGSHRTGAIDAPVAQFLSHAELDAAKADVSNATMPTAGLLCGSWHERPVCYARANEAINHLTV